MQRILKFFNRVFALIGALTVLVILFVIFGYLLPSNTGQWFAQSLKVLDTDGLAATVCADSDVGRVLNDVRNSGDEVGRLWREVLGVPLTIDLGTAEDSPLFIEGSYNPLNSIYTFRYRFREDTGLLQGIELPVVELYINRANLFNPCVQVA